MSVEKYGSRRPKRLSEVRRLRFAEGELAHIDAIAERENMTFSDVVRRIVRADADLFPIVDAALKPEIEKMNEQLRKVGVNLNQAVRAMNEGRVNYEEDLEHALMAVGKLVMEQQARLRETLKTSRKRKVAQK